MCLKKPLRNRVLAEAPETIALQALAYLAARPELLEAFLAQTGLRPETVRAAAVAPGFLPAVIEHILANEAMLIEFADEQGIDPASVAAAHAKLTHAEGGADRVVKRRRN
jgi:hypothetical protein